MDLIVKIIHGTKDERSEALYNLCSADFSAVKVKKLLLNPQFKNIDSTLVVAGLLGAIEKNRETNINLILGFIENNNILMNHESLNIIFNYAASNNNLTAMNILDEKFSIIEKSLASNGLEHLNNKDNPPKGKSIYMNFMGLIEGIQALSINPFILALTKNNFSLVDKMLEKNYPINSNIVESAFSRCVENGDKDSSMYLINNQKTINFLFNSWRVNETLNHPVRYPILKQEIKIILNAKELEQSLSVNPERKPSKLKL